MYCISLKQLSSIQKGIQSAHAIIEYENQYRNDDDFTSWAKNDKTIVVLNSSDYDDMLEIIKILYNNNIKYSFFRESSLNNIITAISFLCPSDIYNKVEEGNGTQKECVLYNIIKQRHLAN